MSMATNSNLVWKREADEHQRWAKIFTRVSTGLAVALLAIGSYAYSTHVQYQDLCDTLRYSARSQPSPSVVKVTGSIIRTHCQG